MKFEGFGFRQFRLKWGFGFRESFGLEGRVSGLGAALRLTITEKNKTKKHTGKNTAVF